MRSWERPTPWLRLGTCPPPERWSHLKGGRALILGFGQGSLALAPPVNSQLVLTAVERTRSSCRCCWCAVGTVRVLVTGEIFSFFLISAARERAFARESRRQPVVRLHLRSYSERWNQSSLPILPSTTRWRAEGRQPVARLPLRSCSGSWNHGSLPLLLSTTRWRVIGRQPVVRLHLRSCSGSWNHGSLPLLSPTTRWRQNEDQDQSCLLPAKKKEKEKRNHAALWRRTYIHSLSPSEKRKKKPTLTDLSRTGLDSFSDAHSSDLTSNLERSSSWPLLATPIAKVSQKTKSPNFMLTNIKDSP